MVFRDGNQMRDPGHGTSTIPYNTRLYVDVRKLIVPVHRLSIRIKLIADHTQQWRTYAARIRGPREGLARQPNHRQPVGSPRPRSSEGRGDSGGRRQVGKHPYQGGWVAGLGGRWPAKLK